MRPQRQEDTSRGRLRQAHRRPKAAQKRRLGCGAPNSANDCHLEDPAEEDSSKVAGLRPVRSKGAHHDWEI